ncbi:MAG: Iron hydrogenase 1 [Candidatus Izimaplasma bacterium HR2]|nr:MAG: Iron hydrogenase 1 [Candidatus Izimaplasma bacterium HR2]
MATITINDIPVKVKNGITILKACESIGVKIPTLCFIEEINEIGFCRICVVEVEGEQDLVSACNTEVTNGMVVKTDSKLVLDSRANTLKLLASKHKFNCWTCPKDGECEFYDLLKTYDVVFDEFGPGIGRGTEVIPGSGISMDQSKCILCKRCVAVCKEVVTAKVLKFRDDDGMNPFVSPTVGLSFDETGCLFCGECVKVCPTGTLHETDHARKVEAMLRDPSKFVIVQAAPSVRASIGEVFGYVVGTPVKEIEGKMYKAFKLLGFDNITDVNWAADLTVMEEGTELIDRLQNGGKLPMFTSCCPSWVRYTELYKPEYIENLSSAKSPHMMQGSLIKHYYAPKYLKKDPREVFVVSVMPCTSKKYEIERPEMESDGVRDVDAVLTVRELAKMIKRKGINFRHLEDYVPVSPLAKFTGAGTIFGASGGVMEASLRTVSEILTKEPLEPIDYKFIMGSTLEYSKGVIKEATVTIAGNKLNIAVVNGGVALKEMYRRIDEGKKQYHFIEFMACSGGCVNGGGMPIVYDLPAHEVIVKRSDALYTQDQQDLPLRKSHENKTVLKAYEEFLGKPGSEVSHKHCHTTYSQKEYRNE